MSHTSVSLAQTSEVHIFSDASEKAIAASAYLRTVSDGLTSVRFIMGRSKLAPLKGHTIPRLELCGTVLATELAEIISVQLDIPLESMRYYTDSRVDLGYISNRTCRLYTYVSNRVDHILRTYSANQWNFISSEKILQIPVLDALLMLPTLCSYPGLLVHNGYVISLKWNLDSFH
ncbi:uncharacterized protein LOC130048439 [Ostrea edulis]|uniref:uncharacterized protein LOC130048439 n=1 Tax=Ostrea edulis TaxID=37623 RepID=UPI0024AF9264|nr:uncharacterized protein LOC130048439 [Ostrea edulis]